MRRFVLILAAGTGLSGAQPALAQSIDARVGKLEGEMRAVQRKVFPGGGGTLLQPDIAAPEARPEIPGSPASTPIADLTARVTELEGQISSLTGQIEQNQFRVRQVEEAFNAYRRATDARLKTLEDGAAAPAAPAAAAIADEEEPSSRPAPARGGGSLTAPTRSPAAGEATAVERPSTGDAAEDDYLYGYRLWQAKRYGEAQAQLKKTVSAHPKSRRASFAQNLLGRAYLDDGKPSLASMAFYDNYKKMPDGERAPDSLFYLAQALIKLKKPADACKVYGELSEVYGSKIGAGMKADIERGRVTAKCS